MRPSFTSDLYNLGGDGDLRAPGWIENAGCISRGSEIKIDPSPKVAVRELGAAVPQEAQKNDRRFIMSPPERGFLLFQENDS